MDEKVLFVLNTLYVYSAEQNSHPPQLPPRNIPLDVKDSDSKTSEQASKSLSDIYLAKLQHMDLSMYGHNYRQLQCLLYLQQHYKSRI